MTLPTEPGPVEERLADRLSHRHAPRGAAPSPTVRTLRRLGGYDRAAYATVAALSTPLLDAPLKRLSELADHSKPWILLAGVHVLLGPREARRAAVAGLAAVAAASLVVNQPMKLAGARARPDWDGLRVPRQRRVRMPSSTSFPSGHSASAAAFAVAVGDLVPVYRLPLRATASLVAFSRVYTGVHYPSDVVVGAAVGAVVGRLTSRSTDRLWGESAFRHGARLDDVPVRGARSLVFSHAAQRP